MFLDISTVFVRIWHDGLLFKLKQNCVRGKLFQLITKSFLIGRFKRVLLNGQTWDWETIQADVPQGSVVGLLLWPNKQFKKQYW